MNSIAVFVLLLILLLAALGLGVYLGLKRNVVQTSVRAGMIIFSVILSAILAATLTPTMFKGMISLFNSFFGSETLAYLSSDTDGANGILSFIYALAAPFTFFAFFFIITLALVGVYNFLCRFYITDEKLAEWAERKKAKENKEDKEDKPAEDGNEVKESALNDGDSAVKVISADEATDFDTISVNDPVDDYPEFDENGEGVTEENAEEKEPDENADGFEAAASEIGEDEPSPDGISSSDDMPSPDGIPSADEQNPEGEVKPEDDAVAAKEENKEEDKKEDKKEKKGLPPKALRAILVAANAVCSLILAVAFVVPTTSLISACSGLIEAAGGEKSAQDYIDEINTNEDTTEAKDFITQITKISSNPIYNIYRALGIPVVYSITGVQVGDSQRQPLSKALVSSEELICSMLELMANADLLSTKVTWPQYADILYDASEGVEDAPYWDKLLGSFLSDASVSWEDGDLFMGITPPFSESMANYDEVLEKDIYKILSENNMASLEFKSVANALMLMSSIACFEEKNFDSVVTLTTLMENIDDESAAVVKEYITDDLLLSLDYAEDEVSFYKEVYVSVLEGSLAVSKVEYSTEDARKAAYEAEAENIITFLTFTEHPESVANNEFILAYVNSTVVQLTVKDVTDSGRVNDPAGIVDELGERSAILKEAIELLEDLTTLTKDQCNYAIAYVTK